MIDKYSLIYDGMKLRYNLLKNSYSLFDIKKDPYEEQDLISQENYQEIAGSLKKKAD